MTDAQRADCRAGTGLVDMTAAIQAAIDFAMYNNSSSGPGGPEVILPSGILKISDTIHLGYGTDFRSVTLRGAGPRDGSSLDTKGCGTSIKPTFNDRPAIAIQGGRGTTVRNLKIQGLNFDHVVATAGTPVAANLTAATWVDPTFPAASSSRYAPYAGIAVDPYSGVRPGTSYPDVTYPAFLGVVAQYAKNLSSRCWFDNVIVEGFVVGVAIQPSDADGNGDFTKFTRCDVNRNQYGISIGNSQSRLTLVEKGEIHRCHTAVVTGKHGRQLGKPDVMFLGTEIRDCMYWVDCPNTSYGGGPHFIGCYGESVYSLGTVGASATIQYSVKFDQCTFKFGAWTDYGVPAYVFRSEGEGFVTFDGCTFTSGSIEGRIALFGLSKAANYRLVGCQNTTTVETEQYERYALNATCGITFNQLSTDLSEFSCRVSAQYNLDTETSDGAVIHTSLASGNRTYLLPVYARTARANLNDPGFGIPRPEYQVGKSGKTFTITGREVEVDLLAAHTEARFALRGGDVGDVIWDSETGATFYVKSRTGTVITMIAQTGYDAAGELLAPLTPTGSLYLLNCRKYTPQYVTYGATSSASPIATTVQRDDAFKAFLQAEMPAGDRLWVDPEVDHYISNNDTLIAASDDTAGTLTASGNFRRTDDRHRFKLFVRAAAPNA